MRFQSAEKLAKELAESPDDEGFQSEKKKELMARNNLKFSCYVLDVSHKEMNLHEIKMLGLGIEEAVSECSKKNGGEPNFKAQYQRYVFDFFKEGSEDLDGGCTEKITL